MKDIQCIVLTAEGSARFRVFCIIFKIFFWEQLEAKVQSVREIMLKFFSFGCEIVFYLPVTPSSSIDTKRDILHTAMPAVVSALCASLRNCQNCVEDFSTKIKEIHQEKRGRGEEETDPPSIARQTLNS